MSTTDNNVEFKLAEVASRVHGLRLDMGLTPEEVASKLDISTEEYLKFEEGTQDFNFTFILHPDSRTSSASLSVS